MAPLCGPGLGLGLACALGPRRMVAKRSEEKTKKTFTRSLSLCCLQVACLVAMLRRGLRPPHGNAAGRWPAHGRCGVRPPTGLRGGVRESGYSAALVGVGAPSRYPLHAEPPSPPEIATQLPQACVPPEIAVGLAMARLTVQMVECEDCIKRRFSPLV